MTAEEYVRSTPHVTEDGGVTLGSRRSTVFLVDADSGRLIRSYKLPDTPTIPIVQNGVENQILLKKHTDEFLPSQAEDSETVEQLLYIKRTDYALQHHSPVTGKVMWNVAFSEFDASFKFPNSGNELGAKYNSVAKPVILQIRDHRLKESLSIFDRRFNGFPSGRPLPLPTFEHDLAPVAFDKLPVVSKTTTGGQVLALPSPDSENSGVVAINGTSVTQMIFTSLIAETLARFHLQYIIPFLPTLLSIVAFILYRYVMFKKQSQLNKVVEEFKAEVGVSKKKKARRLGNKKNNASNEKSPKHTSDDYGLGNANGLLPTDSNEQKYLLTFTNMVDDHVNGRKIGKLVVSNKEIAKGSNGTVVLEGIYEGRSVAVKRLVRTHHDVALKEIQNLIASDQHPNVVRWYGVEYDQDFVYLSLERCTCSLNDLIYMYSESFQNQDIAKNQDSELLDGYTLRLRTIRDNNKDIELWKANGYPTLQLLKLMRLVESLSPVSIVLPKLFNILL